jgi:hypothetical protein
MPTTAGGLGHQTSNHGNRKEQLIISTEHSSTINECARMHPTSSTARTTAPRCANRYASVPHLIHRSHHRAQVCKQTRKRPSFTPEVSRQVPQRISRDV